MRALTTKGKLKYITDDGADLDEESIEYRKWKKNDCLVTSWILNTVLKELAEGFTYIATSRELWKALEYRLCEGNILCYIRSREI